MQSVYIETYKERSLLTFYTPRKVSKQRLATQRPSKKPQGSRHSSMNKKCILFVWKLRAGWVSRSKENSSEEWHFSGGRVQMAAFKSLGCYPRHQKGTLKEAQEKCHTCVRVSRIRVSLCYVKQSTSRILRDRRTSIWEELQTASKYRVAWKKKSQRRTFISILVSFSQ